MGHFQNWESPVPMRTKKSVSTKPRVTVGNQLSLPDHSHSQEALLHVNAEARFIPVTSWIPIQQN